MITLPPSHKPNITNVLNRIPPLWPLKHFVAVNPFAGLSDLTFTKACELLERTSGAAPLQSPAEYLKSYQQGKILRGDLIAVADEKWTVEVLIDALEKHDYFPKPIATIADLLDDEHLRGHWSNFITDEISKWCAVALDENQTTWRSPWHAEGLYAGWRAAAVYDLNPEAFGLKGFRAFVAGLPDDSSACIEHCLEVLGELPVELTEFLHRQLTTISGWAGYVQYLVREGAMRGKENSALLDLLAIRLAYDAALFLAFSVGENFPHAWKSQMLPRQNSEHLEVLVRWQSAYEQGFQRQLAQALAAQPSQLPPERPDFQAIFCIDVRSEVLRRHLEAAAPTAQTIGFAGFFGFPIAHRPAGMTAATTRCPVLLVPAVETYETLTESEAADASSRRLEYGAWKAFQHSAASCFSFVEAAGLSFATALGRQSPAPHTARTPQFPSSDEASLQQRTAMAEGALRNMSLTRNFARLILICGHGSQSANNPYASGLDCGACGGHAGDVNARLAASTLNDPQVRNELADWGIHIPADSYFLAGLHHTTTDAVLLFDTKNLPDTHTQDLVALNSALTLASAAALSERAPALGLTKLNREKLPRSVHFRSADISQVRPEWGLANNAALIAAPRSRTRELQLEGRVFLHDYNATEDPANQVLTLILCAPVVVASWINLQYYASRVDPARYSSGNKALHNVVGGIGVLEGNGGDLRVGLPLQSIHDGENFMHEPRRLTVYIEASRPAIESVLEAQTGVKNLFTHGWIHLCALEGDECYRYRHDGSWEKTS